MCNTPLTLNIDNEFSYLFACRRNGKNVTLSTFSDDVDLEELREQLRFFLLSCGWSEEQTIKILGQRP